MSEERPQELQGDENSQPSSAQDGIGILSGGTRTGTPCISRSCSTIAKLLASRGKTVRLNETDKTRQSVSFLRRFGFDALASPPGASA